MQLLSTGPQTFANSNNTGTGGSSSSDGSSGHASMSDSQTSGSPPAEYARITGNNLGNLNVLNSSNQVTNGVINTSSSYKSVLKSVPEDESNNNSNSGIVGSPVGRFGITGIDKTATGEKRLGDNSLSSSGGKKSSRSRHRNKVNTIIFDHR